MNMQKVGGYASLVQGLAFIAILTIQLAVLPGLGITGPGDPEKEIAAAAITTVPFLALNLLAASFGITIVLVVLALSERMRESAPNRMRIAVIAASIAGALFLANGVMSYSGYPPIVAAKDVVAFRALDAVTGGLITAAIVAAGWSALMWGWAALTAKALPTILVYIILLGAALAILQLFVPILGLIGVVVNVVWTLWLGAALLQTQKRTAGETKRVDTPASTLR